MENYLDPLLISKITSSPSLPWVFAAAGFHIVNVFLGAFIAFMKAGKPPRNIHRYLYYSILTCLACFLIMNQIHSLNGIWEYLVILYFITVIPFSKRWDILLHAFFAVIGLILLPLLIILQVY
ncbi:MAG: hypothetical protein V3U37_06170 [Nitrospinaceae bacterium]